MINLQLLSLVNRLRDTGHFTAVSVTRPFEFEGQRKLDAADRMIAALEEAAHLVVVVEQVRTTLFWLVSSAHAPQHIVHLHVFSNCVNSAVFTPHAQRNKIAQNRSLRDCCRTCMWPKQTVDMYMQAWSLCPAPSFPMGFSSMRLCAAELT